MFLKCNTFSICFTKFLYHYMFQNMLYVGNFGSINGSSGMPFREDVETQKQDKYHFLKSPYQKFR